LESDRKKQALKLVRQLNQIRHRQGKKIDILCNDIVGAHRDFLEKLRVLTFGVDFYESLLGFTDLTSLLDAAGAIIKKHVAGSDVTIFLIDSQGFKLHIADDDQPIDVDSDKIEGYFTDSVVRDICHSDRICTLNDMCHLGFQGNPNVLKNLSAATVPLGKFGAPVGFILISRTAENPLKTDELERIAAIVPGLAKAITSHTETAIGSRQ